MKVGVVGLGAGTLAAYSRPGDTYRFYEINPLVIELARTQFYYLATSPAKLFAARGDGRLTMEREDPQNYDVLAIDAFSGDAIPVHLLTREAMALYFRHLKPDGVLAVHISNRYVDLAPVVAAVSQAAGKSVRLVNTPGGENEVTAASWMLVTADPGAKARAGESTTRMWTDELQQICFRRLSKLYAKSCFTGSRRPGISSVSSIASSRRMRSPRVEYTRISQVSGTMIHTSSVPDRR